MKAEIHPENPVGVLRGRVVIVDRVMDAASGTSGCGWRSPNKELKIAAGLKGR